MRLVYSSLHVEKPGQVPTSGPTVAETTGFQWMFQGHLLVQCVSRLLGRATESIMDVGQTPRPRSQNRKLNLGTQTCFFVLSYLRHFPHNCINLTNHLWMGDHGNKVHRYGQDGRSVTWRGLRRQSVQRVAGNSKLFRQNVFPTKLPPKSTWIIRIQEVCGMRLLVATV